MTIDWTKPVEMEDGRPVRVLCTDGPGMWPIVVITDDGDLTRVKADSPGFRNVIPKPVKRDGFVVVGKDRAGNDIAGAVVFGTADEAAALIGKALHWHSVAHIQWEETPQ